MSVPCKQVDCTVIDLFLGCFGVAPQVVVWGVNSQAVVGVGRWVLGWEVPDQMAMLPVVLLGPPGIYGGLCFVLWTSPLRLRCRLCPSLAITTHCMIACVAYKCLVWHTCLMHCQLDPQVVLQEVLFDMLKTKGKF